MTKVLSISEAAKLVKTGDTVNLSDKIPAMAMVREIIRQGATNLFIEGAEALAQALDMLAGLSRLKRYKCHSFDYLNVG